MTEILLTVLVIVSFVLILCCFSFLLGRLLGTSGQAELTVNGGEPVKAERSQSLLSALAENEIYLPAACGGKGNCGKCLLKVLEGGSPVSAVEKMVLTPEQLAGSVRLACQVRVRNDISVEIDKKLLSASSFTVRLISSEYAGENIKILGFELQNGAKLDFQPGQYVQLILQIPWSRVLRAYSISSSADEAHFTLDIQRIQGGLVSPMLHELKIGEELRFCGPFGDMALSGEHIKKPVILVGGGVGLAPMRSIIEKLSKNGFRQPVWLFHGARSRANLYQEEYFRELAEKNTGFKYIPALSNPMLEEGWLGEKGMIHQSIEKYFPDNIDAGAFVCGPVPMMDAVKKVLLAKGLHSDRILTDPFDF